MHIFYNEKIDYQPLVLRYKLFIPVKYKTNIKGYWLNNGKIYIDNILILRYTPLHIYRVKTLYKEGG